MTVSDIQLERLRQRAEAIGLELIGPGTASGFTLYSPEQKSYITDDDRRYPPSFSLDEIMDLLNGLESGQGDDLDRLDQTYFGGGMGRSDKSD